MRFLRTALAACFLASISLPGLAQEDLAALNSRVEELYGESDYAEAMKVAKQLVEVAERQLGPDHPDTVGYLANVALLYHTQGQYAEAEPLLKRSLAIFEKTLGPDHPNTKRCRENLSKLHDDQADKASNGAR